MADQTFVAHDVRSALFMQTGTTPYVVGYNAFHFCLFTRAIF
jgi:hypothetical protein